MANTIYKLSARIRVRARVRANPVKFIYVKNVITR